MIVRRFIGATHRRRAAAFVLAGVLTTTSALAQSAVERNLPEPVVQPSGAALSVGETDYGKGDETPLGVDVKGVRLIGPHDEAEAPAPAGISLGRIEGAPVARLEAALAPFLGKPLTRAAIVRMQGAVAGAWRQAGFPFVSVTVPPQEITGGVLRLRVVEFHAGAVRTTDAAGNAVERDLAPDVRIAPGRRIEAAALEEDLDWLNRNPFRHVEGMFSPGDETGASDFTLKVTRQKPFSVFGSYANTGSRGTGRDRWSVGGGFWIPEFHDLTASYRFTRSGEAWQDGEPFELDAGRPGYLSHAALIELPTFPRQALSIAPNYVKTNEIVTGTPFSFENTTFELPILYRSAVSNILPGHYWGDVYVGAEPKWVERSTSFDGTEVARGKAGLFNLVAGWAGEFNDRYGRTSIDARVKFNPGGVVAHNSAEDWATFTGGRVRDNTYVTAGVDILRVTELPRGFSWISQISGLVAGQALPDTERLGLGGYYAVRGYDNDDASVDAGLVWRNEIRLPTFSPLGASVFGRADNLSPFVFLDLGHGYDFAARQHPTLASTGLGFDYGVADNLAVSLTGALALRDAASTSNGDWTFNASVRLAF